MDVTPRMNFEDALGIRVFSGLVKLTANRPNFGLKTDFSLFFVIQYIELSSPIECTYVRPKVNSNVSISDHTVEKRKRK